MRPAAGSRRRGRWRRRRPGCSGAGRGRRRRARTGRPGRGGGRAPSRASRRSRVRRRPASANGAALAMAAASAARSVTGAQGTRPADTMARYSYQPLEVEVAQGDAGRRVLDHDHPPALAVAAARGEAGGVEQAGQHARRRRARGGIGGRRRCCAACRRGRGPRVAHRSGVRWVRVRGVTPAWRALSRWPLVVAPMAGGPVDGRARGGGAAAGALGFLAGGYKTADRPGGGDGGRPGRRRRRVRREPVRPGRARPPIPRAWPPTRRSSSPRPPPSGRRWARRRGTTTTTRPRSTPSWPRRRPR